MSQQAPAPAQPAPANTSNAPESLEDVLATTRPRGWWALATIAGIVVAVLVWSVVATIPQQITVPAAISASALQTAVVSPTSGQVAVSVTAGTEVKEGQELASVTPFAGGAAVQITAPTAGTVGNVVVGNGQGVEPGTEITSVLRPPNPRTGTVVVTYLPASAAELFNANDEVVVVVTDIANSRNYTVPAKVDAVAISPSNVEAIANETGSPAFATELAKVGNGVVYRVSLTLTATSETLPSISVAPGEIVQIVNTYAQPHPIELLFGGR